MRILVTALEPSANLHLKEVLKAFWAEFGEFELCGIYDENLCAEFEANLKQKSKENFSQNSNAPQNLNLSENSKLNFQQNLSENSQILNSSKNLETNSQQALNSNENSQSLNLYDKINSQEILNLNSAPNSQEPLNLDDTPNSKGVKINKPLYSSHEFSAMGFVEVLPLIFKAKRAIKELTSLALERQNANSYENSSTNSPKPFDAVLCIASPAFNIPFAKALNAAGVRAKKIYYILPQVWAWKKGRIPIIEANFDELASILPFDGQFFSKSTFVGHPLLDELKEFKDESDFEMILSKEESKKTLSFLPGSRRSEIKRLMPVFRELALNFKGEKILCVPPFNLARLDELYGDTKGFKVVTNTPQALKKSDFAFICSGTATLEAALIGTPFILTYKAKAIDVFIARLFVRLKHIGLANIMCDFAGKTELNPEFLQNEVSAKNLFEAYRKFDFKEFFDKVSFLKNYLHFGSAKNVAKMLANKG